MRERNYGIDLLKILSMYLVVVLHVLGQGGIIYSVKTFSPDYFVGWAMTLFVYVCVDLFALASGYVSYKSKFKPRRIVELYLIVLFYGVLFLILFAVSGNTDITLKNILLTVFPSFVKNQPLYYWYFTAYLILFLLMPFINFIICKFTRKKLAFLCLILLFMYSVVPALMQNDFSHTISGYSYIWIIAMYFLGAYFAKYRVFEKIKKYRLFILLIISLALTFCGHFVVNYYYLKNAPEVLEGQADYISNEFGMMSIYLKPSMFTNYTFPTTVINSVLLLGIFSKIKIKSKFLQSKISAFVPLVFSVYIIHTNKFVFEQIIGGLFEGYAAFSPFILVLATLGTALVIFVVCIMIDMLRFELFKLIKVDKFCLFAENKLKQIWNRLFENKTEVSNEQ